MNAPDPETNPRWQELVRQARADQPAPVDVTTLLRQVRNAPPAGLDWLALWAETLAARRTAPWVLTAVGGFAFVAAWQVWECWQSLAWLELMGGAL